MTLSNKFSKHLGIIIDKSLTCNHQINNVATKLNKGNAMLSKIRHFVNFNNLKLIYHTPFESHLNYSLVFELRMKTQLKDFWSLKRNP